MKKIFTFFTAAMLCLSASSQTKGLNFDGNDDYVYVPAKPGMLTGSTITYESWVNLRIIEGASYLVNKGVDGNYFALIFYKDDLDFEQNSVPYLNVFLYNGEDNGQIIYDIPESMYNQWHHFAVTFGGGKIILYVDGNEVGSSNFSGSIPESGEAMTFGNGPGYGPLSGTVDEIRIWNVVRTRAQILADMNREISPTTPGLVAYYRLNEGITNGNNTAITTINDQVATNRRNGTIVNFARTGVTSNFTTGYPTLVLPLKNSSFVATKKGSGVELFWKESASDMPTNFEIERSENGVSFAKIGQLAGAASTKETSWSFVDTKPSSGTNYYRLKLVEADNRISYSSILAVSMTGSSAGLQIYPVPTRSTINVEINAPRGQVDILIKNLAGATVKSVRANSTGNTIYSSIDVSSLSKGTYVIMANKLSSMFVKQ